MKLLIGGSPCTHWSIAKGSTRETQPEGIGWELFKNYLIAIEKFKPDYFLYENNKSMAPAIRAKITEELGVESIEINSSLVSAQNRNRLYWTNIPGITLPEDRGILLADVLSTSPKIDRCYELAATGRALSQREMDFMIRTTNGKRKERNHFDFAYHKDATKDKATCVMANTCKGIPYNVLVEPVRIETIKSGTNHPEHNSRPYRVYSVDGKSVTLCGEAGGMGSKTGLYAIPDYTPEETGIKWPIYEVRDGFINVDGNWYKVPMKDGFYIIRKLTVEECMRLQTIPDTYEFPVSATQAYKMLGNGWTMEVIKHILSYIPDIMTTSVDVLSMYDGMSTGMIALKDLGVDVRNYWATEIDKYCIKTSRHNFPEIKHIGDAFSVREENWTIGGNE